MQSAPLSGAAKGKYGGIRRRFPGAVHYGLKSLSTINGIRKVRNYVRQIVRKLHEATRIQEVRADHLMC
jgi:hypothetical protein